MRLSLFIFFILFALSGSFGQRVCGTLKYETSMFNKEFHSNQSNTQSRDTLPDEIISIPVVFHVLYNNAIQNISDAQILSQLQVLNEDYSRLNADASNTPNVFKPFAADVRIKFCIARADALGRPTNGIIRKHTNNVSYNIDDAMKSSVAGGDDAWDCNRYLNIWVCNLAGHNLGYATQPGDPADKDGIVIQFDALGKIGNLQPDFNKGRTATHEIGHWLGLKHIWGDSDCGNDGIYDTPQQSSYNNNCPSFPHMSSCSPNSNGDMFMNFMDYTNDACMNLFTTGQKNKIRSLFALNGPRNSFLNSSACDSVTESAGSVPANSTPAIPSEVSLSIYPNPIDHDLNIVALNGYELKGKSISIYNLTGSLIYKSTGLAAVNKINLSFLTSGVYLLKIGNNAEKKVFKIIKL